MKINEEEHIELDNRVSIGKEEIEDGDEGPQVSIHHCFYILFFVLLAVNVNLDLDLL